MRISIIILAASLSGCISASLTQKAPADVNFKAFKTVAYSVHAAKDIETDQNPAFSQQEIAMFRSSLGSRMEIMGYEVVTDKDAADFCIDVAVTEAKQGNAAGRFLVGFGAGRAAMQFDATFQTHGRQVAAFSGGKSMTGMAPGEIWANVDDIQIAAVTGGTRQIMEFILNGGDIPAAAPIGRR